VKESPDVHLTALINVLESFKKPNLYMFVNTKGAKILDSAVNKFGSKKPIYVSDTKVYGNPILPYCKSET